MTSPVAGFKSLFKNRKKAVFFLLILIVLGGLVWWKHNSASTTTPQYQTETAEKGTLVSSITASGTITAGGSVDVTTSATGIVSTVYVKDGDTVVSGQKLADITLDQSSQQRQAAAYASYLGASNQVNSAQARINSLQSALFKANQTFVNGKGTENPEVNDPTYIEQRADWLQAEADYKNQQTVIAQAQSSLSSSWLSYLQNSSTIVAPTSGIVSNLTVAPGIAISSSSNTSSSISSQKLGKVTVPDAHTQATVSLSEIDAVKIKPDQKVTLTLDAYPDKTFTGKVLIVDTNGSVSSGVTTYPAVISFDASEPDIYPNMAATAKIIIKVKNNVLLVPSAAIQMQGTQATVRLLKNGKISNSDVEIGDSNDTQTEIISGINEGDVVVTSAPTSNIAPVPSSATSVFGGTLGGGTRNGVSGAGAGNVVRFQAR